MWLLQSSNRDGDHVNRRVEESDAQLECVEEDAEETSRNGVGSDKSALGLSIGKGGPDCGDSMGKLIGGAEDDEEFQ